MITLIGHGYVGCEIARVLDAQGRKYDWQHHTDAWPKSGSVVINAAGFTGTPNVDECEYRKKETIEGHIVFPLRLEQHGQPIIHITSGCVYNGYKEGGWTEDDPPNFDFTNGSFYSGCKAMQQEVLDLTRHYLLRIRLPFGARAHPRNYLTKLKNYERLIDVTNSLSSIEDVAKTAVFFAVHFPEPGIYNVVCRGSVSTREVASLMGLAKRWFTDEEFSKAVRAPRSNCTLSSAKLNRLLPVRSVADALREAIA